ncbi:MAG TPA: 3-oxoacyl-[acyl-carrier-protein] synthase III C-terminal domain-containing protein [Terriglobia bacterium]|nr:3-oxoacyl-[acyl-carrier-protein] synthase III C-terminal domain-containing protein [Terriglobia bacterium]
MYIIGLGTATPLQRYTQRECWDALRASDHFPNLNSRSRAILKKVLGGDNGICTRYLAFDNLSEAFVETPGTLHARFTKYAPTVAAQAGENALRDAGSQPGNIDAVIISTCTGYLCPGLTSYVSERLGLRPDALALDLVGQGCGAALPNMRVAEALTASGRCRQVLSICVEICSAAFFLDDAPGVLISACLFGDGGGAAVLAAEPIAGKRRIQWKAAGTTLSAVDRESLRFEQKGGMLRNILGPGVPELAAKHAETVLTEVLERTKVSRGQITGWIMHAGGREILLAMQRRLGLTEHDLRWSASVLRDYGNVSSPCVYFVLQATLDDRVDGGLWWMSSFGAGFSCHGALLEVE